MIILTLHCWTSLSIPLVFTISVCHFPVWTPLGSPWQPAHHIVSLASFDDCSTGVCVCVCVCVWETFNRRWLKWKCVCLRAFFYFWHMYWRQRLHLERRQSFFIFCILVSGGCHSVWATFLPPCSYLTSNIHPHPSTHPRTHTHTSQCNMYPLLCAVSPLARVHVFSSRVFLAWNSPLRVCCSSFAGGVRSVCRLLSRGSVKLRGFPPWVAIGISLCIAMGNGTFLWAGRV